MWVGEHRSTFVDEKVRGVPEPSVLFPRLSPKERARTWSTGEFAASSVVRSKAAEGSVAWSPHMPTEGICGPPAAVDAAEEDKIDCWLESLGPTERL